jgi:hypothetical protein
VREHGYYRHRQWGRIVLAKPLSEQVMLDTIRGVLDNSGQGEGGMKLTQAGYALRGLIWAKTILRR